MTFTVPKHVLRWLAAVVAATLLCLGAASCSRAGDLPRGEGCGLNSECAAPLGCRVGKCRRVCVVSRDCGAGYRCLIDEGETSGGCQLPEEVHCALSSECPPAFECVFGTCTQGCVEDRDCRVEGAICQEDPDAPGILGCFEPLDELCIYDSDCPEPPESPIPLVCAFDGTCQVECRETPDPARDCPFPRVCMSNICMLPEPLP